MRVELASGRELLFCAHHAREHAEKLHEVALTIHDETDTIGTRQTNLAREEH